MPRLQCEQGRASESHQTPLAVLLNETPTVRSPCIEPHRSRMARDTHRIAPVTFEAPRCDLDLKREGGRLPTVRMTLCSVLPCEK